ncbi:hypothetical protein E1B28_001960 [Marasmius oreades]|uniref:Uncharacterized protein n=1 Tax=Marasmius oreades TaxID=181124 RepID=A0A9P8AG55_9AGAR|nr:uncharacterized protein E1B28_001960 [Marasmius oreades]KAG7100183.1 hypothetical protein E1B28_001960 [Marasmius oreades]
MSTRQLSSSSPLGGNESEGCKRRRYQLKKSVGEQAVSFPPSSLPTRPLSHPSALGGHESETSKRWWFLLKKRREQALGISQVVLETVKDVADVAPSVPFLREAAGITLAILGAVERMVKNKQDIKLLTTHACEAIYTVQRATGGQWDGQQAEDCQLRESLEKFKETMSNIQVFAEERTKKSLLFRFVMSNSDQQEIADFRTQLNHTVNLFILRLNIRSYDLLVEIRNNTRHISRSATQLSTDISAAQSPLPSPMASQFGGVLNGHISGTVSVNNVSGNQVHTVNNSSNSVSNSGNIYTRTTIESNNRFSI